MSEPVRATALQTATIWPLLSKDKFGRASFGSPYLITCTFEQGSSKQYRDQQGTLYIPASIYWYEYDPAVGLPKFNDFIAFGNFLTEPDPVNIDTAELIKNRIRQDNSLLGDVDDVMVLT